MTAYKPLSAQISTAPKNETKGGTVSTSAINKDDAKNALAGLFGAKQIKNGESKSSDNTIVSSINKDDAKNALAGLFGAKTAPKSTKSNTKTKDNDDGKLNLEIATPSKLQKYVKLSKIMPLHVLENRMKMDGVTRMLIGQLTKR